MSTFLGADGARELISWLGGNEPSARIELRADAAGALRSLVCRRPAEPDDRLLDRHVFSFAPYPARPARPAPPALPAGVLLLTNIATPSDALSLPADATVVVVTDQGAAVRCNGRPAEPVTADAFAELVAGQRPRHVRVLVDNGDPLLNTAGWSAPARALLRLHEWVFLTARACADWLDEGSSFLITVRSGLSDTGTPLPFTGLFTGLAKSLALELPQVPVVATLHDRGAPAEILGVAATELGARQLLPVVRHFAGQRSTIRAVRAPVRAAHNAPLSESSIVVAAGGGRGVGAPILAALAKRYRPRIIILGSTALDGYPSELLDTSAEEAAGDRARYIRDLVTGPERVPVREANARFDRLQVARNVRANLAELRLNCGADRVTYLHCDLRDTAAVRAALEPVLAEHGDIDLLLNIAGTNRASDLRVKSRHDFIAVRDLKLHTYLNLKDALRDHPPRRWCNFGSQIGFTGQVGETDYASANDFLNSAALSGAPGEFTIGWGLWRDTGLGATPIMRAFLAKIDRYTAIPNDEGVAHFLAELENTAPDPVTVLFGAKEWAAISAVLPDYWDFCQQETEAGKPPRRFPFIDEIVRDGEDELTAVRTFDLDRDAYLDLHQVYGYATLPGTFVPELAAEAASALVPHRVPVVFEDLRLESFLRVYRKGRAETKKVQARVIESDEVETVVAVRVVGDLIAPNGRVLANDRLHFSVTVRMRDNPTPPPRWDHWDDHGSRTLIDPYHVAGSAVLLREVFKSTTNTRWHPLGRRGRLSLDGAAIERWFPDLLVPSVLLDGLVRVAVLDLVEDQWTPVAIPRWVRRIDLYSTHTDASLANWSEAVELYVTPSDLDLEADEPDNRAVAVSASGDVLVQVKDIVGAIVGYVDQGTGKFVDRGRFDRGEREALSAH